MSIVSWIGGIFKPAAELIDTIGDTADKFHTSTEEKGEIKIRLKELALELEKLQNTVAIKVLDFQSQLAEQRTKMAIAEQTSGNWLSKSWRPVCSILSMGCLIAMGTNYLEFNEWLATIFGSFLGIYTGARSYEKKVVK